VVAVGANTEYISSERKGDGMTATASAPEDEQLKDPERLEIELARHMMTTSSGTAGLSQATWLVLLTTDGSQIRRDVWRDKVAWEVAAEGWEPEGVIWPTWPVQPADEMSSAEAALTGVQKYWNKSGNRLRDSAKWMATVLGAALATLVGTSPLTTALRHRTATEMAFLLLGLLLLCVTLFLVMQVMRPQTVSFTEVQCASERRGPFGSPLGRWREIVESQEDLYLPCGVKCLTSLRQSMIIEKMTLMALAKAKETKKHHDMRTELEEAQEARAVRLTELRHAAAQVAIIGEYYKLRARSSRATYGGILCTLFGIAAILIAFT
jgi:hypothetical protein